MNRGRVICFLWILLLLYSCQALDPDIPDWDSRDGANLFPEVWIARNADGVGFSTATSVELPWRWLSGEPQAVQKLLLCYKNHTETVPADTTDRILDLLPYLESGDTVLHLTGLEPSCRYHYRVYRETSDSSAYTPYEYSCFFATRDTVEAGTWMEVATIPDRVAEADRMLSCAISGKGYAGLAYNSTGTARFYPSLYCYNPEADAWRRCADFPGMARRSYVSFAVGDKIYVGLGVAIEEEETDLLKDFWVYDTEADVWNRLPDFPGTQRVEATGFSVGGKGYVLRGNNRSRELDDLWEYDSETGIWQERTPNPEPFLSTYAFELTTIPFQDRLFLLVANQENLQESAFYEYIPSTDRWEERASFPFGERYGSYSFEYGNSLVVGSGYGSILYERAQWQYFPDADVWVTFYNNPPAYLDGGYVQFTLDGKGYAGSFYGFWRFEGR